jgi:hypothetical protein
MAARVETAKAFVSHPHTALYASQLRRRRLEYRTHLRRGARWPPVPDDQAGAARQHRGRPEVGPDPEQQQSVNRRRAKPMTSL